MDLMEALRASVEAAKKNRAAQKKPSAAETKRTRRKAS
jgi:non-homologous end joining protein Ku